MSQFCLRPTDENNAFESAIGKENLLKIINSKFVPNKVGDIYSSQNVQQMIKDYGADFTAHYLYDLYEQSSDNNPVLRDFLSDWYTSEMMQIKEKAIADGTFMKAPNGKPTNLDERQWLQVRTKAFKEWFGDWIKTARFYSKGFEFMIGIPGSGKSTYLRKINNPNVVVVSPDDIRRELTGNISDQSKNREVWQLTEQRINEFLSQGKYVILDATNVNTGLRKSLLDRIKQNNERVSTYSTLFDVDPEESKKRIKKDIEDKVDRSVVPDDVIDRMYGLYKETLDVIDSEGYDDTFRQNYLDGVSKVVDENGEPLVVYHGSDYQNDATIEGDWSKNALPYATYFSARKYANGALGNYYSNYLNIKNPLYEDADFTEDAIQDEEFFKTNVINKGYDGIISKRNAESAYLDYINPVTAQEIVATNPNQIKSATDNNGDFSSKNNNIYYSKRNSFIRTGLQSIDDIFGIDLFNSNKEITLNQAITALQQNKKISPVVDFLKTIKDKNPNVVITRSKHVYNENGEEVDGLYKVGTDNDVIVISENSSKPVSQVLVHEILHALFLDSLNTNPNIKANLQSIINEAKRVLGDNTDLYGLSSPEEFISELFTDNKLTSALNNIRGINNNKATGLLVKIKEWLKNCLHYIFPNHPTLYDNALYEIEQLIQTPIERYNQQEFDYIQHTIKSKITDILSSDIYDYSYILTKLQELKSQYPDFISDDYSDFIVRKNDKLMVMFKAKNGRYLLYNRNTVNSRYKNRMHTRTFASESTKSPTELFYFDKDFYKTYGATINDQQVLIQAVNDGVNALISSFLYDVDNFILTNNITNDKYQKIIKDLSVNQNVLGLLKCPGFSFYDVFNKSIQSIKDSVELWQPSKADIFKILDDDSIYNVLKEQVKQQVFKGIYGLSIKENITEDSSEDESRIEEIVEEDFNDIIEESVDSESEENQDDEYDALADMLKLKDASNTNREQKDKQDIYKILGGFLDTNPNKLTDYGLITYINPALIYCKIKNVCYDCKSSEEMLEKIGTDSRLCNESFTAALIERLKNNPIAENKLWHLVRGQIRTFIDISSEGDYFHVVLPNILIGTKDTYFKINTDKQTKGNNSRFFIKTEGSKNTAYLTKTVGDKLTLVNNVLSYVYDQFTQLKDEDGNLLFDKKKNTYSEEERIQLTNTIQTQFLNKSVESFFTNSTELFQQLQDSDKFTKVGEEYPVWKLIQRALNLSGCYDIGIDCTEDRIVSAFTKFYLQNGSYVYSNQGYELLSLLNKTTTPKQLEKSLSSLSVLLNPESNYDNQITDKLLVKTYFYRDGQGYYSFGYVNKVSRFDTWLHSVTNKEFIDWYEQKCQTDFYFEAYNTINKTFSNLHDVTLEDKNKLFSSDTDYISNHDILYKLYIKAKESIDKDQNNNGKLLLGKVSHNKLSDYTLGTFAVQGDKKISQLTKAELKIRTLAQFFHTDTSQTSQAFAGLPLSDKSASFSLMYNEDDNIALSIKSLAKKSLLELQRIKKVYDDCKDVDKSMLVKEPNFTIIVDENKKIPFGTKNAGCAKFMYLPFLNTMLNYVNKCTFNNDTNTYVLPNNIIESLSTNPGTQQALKTLVESMANILYTNDDNLISLSITNFYNSLMFGSTANTPNADINAKITHGFIYQNFLKHDVMESFLPLFLQNNSVNIKLAKKVIGITDRDAIKKALMRYVLNHAASLAEQTFIYSGDIVRYGSGNSFSKRAAELNASGIQLNPTAKDYTGAYFEDRDETSPFRNKKVTLTLEDIKGNNFISSLGTTENYERLKSEILTTFKSELKNEFGLDENSEEYKKAVYNREKYLEEHKNQIISGKIDATDGQSIISLKYARRFLGKIGKLSPEHQQIIDKLIDYFEEAYQLIKKSEASEEYQLRMILGTEINSAFNSQWKALKNKVNALYNDMYDTEFSMESIKQFTTTILNDASNKISTSFESKDSEVCLCDLKQYIESYEAGNGSFLIDLMHVLNTNQIDALNFASTNKQGIRKMISTSNGPETLLLDLQAAMLNTEENPLDYSLVHVIPEEDLLLQQEGHKNFINVHDTLGGQVERLMVQNILPSHNYKIVPFNHIKPTSLSGEQLYNTIQQVLYKKLQKSVNNLTERVGISKGLATKIVLESPITDNEHKKIVKKFSDLLKDQTKSSGNSYKFELDENGEFIFPSNESTSINEISKTICSIIKRDVVNQKVPGGQLIQKSGALNDIFVALNSLKNNNKLPANISLDNTLQCKIDKDKNGNITSVYMEAEIPFMWKGAFEHFINKDGSIDMNKIPEEMKHAIVYRIPTEGLCSIFHIKVKRFTDMQNGHIALPAEITQITGSDFDIDKLFTIFADINDKFEYVKPPTNKILNSEVSLDDLSEKQLNNMLFEMYLTALNNSSHYNGYIEYGGYEDTKHYGLAMYLYKNSSLSYNECVNMSLDELEEAVNNMTLSPCSPANVVDILQRNFTTKEMLGIGANNMSLNAELSKLNCNVNLTRFNTGLNIGNSEIIKHTAGTRDSKPTYIKFCPKWNVNYTMQCNTALRQIVAAAADGAKDSFLLLAGFNKFTVGIYMSLINLGCEMEDALLFINNPIVQKYAEQYELMNISLDTDSSEVLPNTVFTEFLKLEDSDFNIVNASIGGIDLTHETLVNHLSTDYTTIKNTDIKNYQDILRIMHFCLLNNTDMISASSILKIDSKSNTTWNSVAGAFATLLNANNFLHKVQDGESTFDPQFYEVFNFKNTKESLPRIAYLLNQLPLLINTLWSQLNPLLGSQLYDICNEIAKQTDVRWSEDKVRDVLNSISVYTMFQGLTGSNPMLTHFSSFGSENTMRDILLNNIIKQKESLIAKYPNNLLLSTLDFEKINDKLASKYSLPAADINKLTKLSIDPQKLPYESLKDKLTNDIEALAMSDDEEAVDFINNIFMMSVLQTGFNRYTSRTPLRYFSDRVLYNILDGDYIKYHKEFLSKYLNNHKLSSNKDMISWIIDTNKELQSYKYKGKTTAIRGFSMGMDALIELNNNKVSKIQSQLLSLSDDITEGVKQAFNEGIQTNTLKDKYTQNSQTKNRC